MPDRVLITCSLAWDSLPLFAELFGTHDVHVDVPQVPGQQLSEEELLPLIGDYHGILAGDDHLTRRVMEVGANLKVISKWGAGVDAIDLDAARELGISVFNTPGVFGDELGDYAMGFILMLARRQHEVDSGVRSGEWRKVRGSSLAGRTLGVIGLGSGGKALVRRAVASRMIVVGSDIQAPDALFLRETGIKLVGLDQLLPMADIVSLHTPASPENRHLLDNARLKSMKQGAWLVNTARGSLVDEEALITCLLSGQVGAAALDVFDVEPIPRDHPFLTMDNVILGSHNGSNTHEAVARATDRSIKNLLIGLGKLPDDR